MRGERSFFVNGWADDLLGVAVERRGRHFVREGHIATSAEVADVGAVFVFDAEEGPHCAAEDLGEGDEEGGDGRMLQLEWDDGVEDPVEAKEGVDGHGEVVHPDFFVAEGLAEERVFGAGVAERPVVVDVPEAGVDGIYGGEGDEEGAVGGCLFDAVDAEGYVEDDCCDVFS